MSVIHSHGRTYQHGHLDGRCDWVWIWESAVLACDDATIPGGRYCPEHEIEAQQITTTTPEGPTE